MRFKFLAKSKIAQLPKSPGVYIFKNVREFLYIGKSANIKKRVKNHFQRLSYRNNLFRNKVKRIGYIKTGSEIEALILEANLIKKYQPKYNIVWRDDKNYFYAGITKEEFPRVFITHQTKIKNPASQADSPKGYKLKIKNIFIGPFVEGKALKQTLKVLRRVFPYRSCKTLPKKPCLWYQLDRCPAPCLLKTILGSQLPVVKTKIKEECQRNTKNLTKVLKGEKKQVLRNLEKEMKEAVKEENFEEAAKIRNQLTSLEKILAHSKIFSFPTLRIIETKQKNLNALRQAKKVLNLKKIPKRIEAYDISNIQGQQATGSMVTFIKGEADKNFYRKFKLKIAGKPNDTAMLKEVLKRRFSHPEWPFPDLILIDGGKAQLNAALQCLPFRVKHIRVCAIAKKKNELFIEGRKKSILLKTLPREIFNLILQLRDEAHRFALAYHHKLREIDLKLN